VPTAQMFVADIAATPNNSLAVAPAGSGVETFFHAWPFQCSASVCVPVPAPIHHPTAHALQLEMTATPLSLSPLPILGGCA